jgi:heme-degrading monooxygenase HmoA
MPGFTYIWEFTVAPGREAEFTKLYGPDGAWVSLFRTAPGYFGTHLLRSRVRLDTFLTIDRWASESAWREFREAHAEEFEAIDTLGASLTLSERLLGEFDEAG